MRRWRSQEGFIFLMAFVVFIWGWTGLSYFSYGKPAWQYRNFSGRLEQRLKSEDPNNFQVAIIGDCRENMEAVERILIDARRRSEFGFILGDLVNNGTASEFYFLIHELKELEREFGQYPLYTVIGNEDLDKRKSSGLYQELFGPDHFWLFLGKTLFIGINNVEKEGYEKELKWLDRVLKEKSGNAEQIFILMHKPPYHPLTAYHCLSKTRTEELMKVLHKYPISAVFAAHIHSHLEYKIKGIKVYVNGEGGAPQISRNPQYGYLLLKVYEGGYQVEHISLGNIYNWDKIEQIVMVKMHPLLPWLSGICLLMLLGFSVLKWKKLRLIEIE